MEIKKEKIKLYVVLALALIFAVNGYFRLVHGKNKQSTSNEPSVKGEPVSKSPTFDLRLPALQDDEQKSAQSIIPSIQAAPRDIFIPMVTPIKAAEKKPVAPKPVKDQPPPDFRLKGTIVGGKKPIAIIDDRFVSTGGWIKGFQVVSIGKKEVHLDSGNKKIVLEILKNE